MKFNATDGHANYSCKRENFDPVRYYSEYPEGVSKGAVLMDGNVHFYRMMGCHRWIGNVKGNVKGLWSSLWVRDEKDRAEAEVYWSYILDPETSPWRSILKGVEIVRSKDGDMLAFFIPADTTYPAMAVVNLCVATRLPWEHRYCVRLFNKMKQEGFTDAQSLFAMVHFGMADDGETLTENTAHVHFAYNAFQNSMLLKNFEEGTMPGVQSEIKFGVHDYVGIPNSTYGWKVKGGINVVWNDTSRKSGFMEAVFREQKYQGNFRKWAAANLGTDLILNKNKAPKWSEALPRMKESVHAW